MRCKGCGFDHQTVTNWKEFGLYDEPICLACMVGTLVSWIRMLARSHPDYISEKN